MLACRKGFLQIVYALHDCPYLDVNLQDNEGNTALMIASQAGMTTSRCPLMGGKIDNSASTVAFYRA